MAMNKFMHPRNVYKNPPDFSDMALKYPEFMAVSKLDINGKVRIDFKDPKALRILTKCLLNRDFSLDVYIPEDRLVPTLPLRLNYLLWVEDLMAFCGKQEDISGIDIGTGACAIYPLLAAKKNNWNMIGTESDDESLRIASENIDRNNLSNLITLKKSTKSSLLQHLFVDNSGLRVDFCMCNPPFYSSIEELIESRSPARPEPKNAFTGSPQELITEGGEVEFINKIIQESQELKDRIRIYTTMIGHKQSLKSLTEMLRAEGVKNFTHTEFCQGRTTRWGLAWTYLQDFDIRKIEPPKRDAFKKHPPMSLSLPELPDKKPDINTMTECVLNTLKQIKLEPGKIDKRGPKRNMEFKSYENTWSNQRRKRRMDKIKEVSPKKAKIVETSLSETEVKADEIDSVRQKNKNNEENFNKSIDESAEEIVKVENLAASDTKIQTNDGDVNATENHDKHDSSKYTEKMSENLNKSTNESAVEVNDKPAVKLVENVESNDRNDCNVNKTDCSKAINESECRKKLNKEDAEPILHFKLTVSRNDKNVVLELEYVSGVAGKDGMHQILQYIKNKWK